MRITKKYLDELTYVVIGCAIEVHKNLGPGLLESVYEKCFMRELELRGIRYQNQLAIDLDYKGLLIDALLRYDVLVEDVLLVELKSIEGFLPIHAAISLTYMRLLKKPKSILINFNCTNIFKNGQKTLVNDLYKLLPDT
jgi:GxxExxY protein